MCDSAQTRFPRKSQEEVIAPTRISVKAVPGASKDEIVGKLGEDWKIRVSAPPEGGKANKKICGLLADALGVPHNAVAVFSGHSSSRKIIEISVSCDLSLLAGECQPRFLVA